MWKGGSTITMAHELKNSQADAVVIAVDTFLGSAEHYLNPEWRDELRLSSARPRVLEDFLANIARAGVVDYVLPLALDSVNAAHLLQQAGVRPDVVHIDAAHDVESVTADLSLWFALLRPGCLPIVGAVRVGTSVDDRHRFRKLFDMRVRGC